MLHKQERNIKDNHCRSEGNCLTNMAKAFRQRRSFEVEKVPLEGEIPKMDLLFLGEDVLQ